MGSFKWFILLLAAGIGQAQVTRFPFTENFDSVSAPALPAGWLTTTNRSDSGDFRTTTSTVLSPPNAVVSTNATISQSLISPSLDFSNKVSDSLTFHERRSSSHNCGLLVEASTDGGGTFSIQVGDTLRNPGAGSYTVRRLKLPPVLDNQREVRIRWRVVGDGTGRAGSIRFDNVTVSIISALDAGISDIRYAPKFPVAGDSLSILATVRNFGLQAFESIPVEFYKDSNGDSIPQSSELIERKIITQRLQPGDTAVAELQISGLAVGDQTIIVQTALAGDEDTENDVSYATISVGVPRQSVVINEVMYAPANEPEWVELFNISNSAVDLKNWRLSNRNTGSQYAITEASVILAQQDFVVVTKDSALFLNVHRSIPSRLVQSSSLPTYLFGNTGDAVVLFDSRGAIMDSVRYYTFWGGTGGKSLERIEPQKASTDSTNWGSSTDSGGCTPGRQNSLTAVDFDLRVFDISAANPSPTSLSVTVVVGNVGRLAASNFSVSLFVDNNQDSIPQPGELLQTQASISTLQPTEPFTPIFTWNNPPPGQQYLIAVVDYEKDMRPSNNTLRAVIRTPYSPGSVVVNEIMYQPLTGQSEYIELYNRSGRVADVSRWYLSDKRDQNGKANEFHIDSSRRLLGPQQYLVLAADSTIFRTYPGLLNSHAPTVIFGRSGLSLNDNGDDDVVHDLTGRVIDSVRYSPQWHNPNLVDVQGLSLERINPGLGSNDPRNWSTSASPFGGTPGNQNSIYTTSVASGASLSCFPNPFSPDGDGFEDFTMISYELPTTAALVRVRIYDSIGRLIRTLADGEPSGAHGQVIWDGFTDDRQKARMGIYIILLEALDAYGGTVRAEKGIVVVAAKL